MLTILLFAISLILVLAGLVGTVLPAVPGVPAVFAGLLLASWAEDFAGVGAGTLGALGVLTLLSIAAEWGASALGVQRVGATRGAILGAAIGTLLGAFLALPGLLLGPLVGAAIGEYLVTRDREKAGRAAVAAWIGFAVGTVSKLIFAGTMIVVWLFARFWG